MYQSKSKLLSTIVLLTAAALFCSCGEASSDLSLSSPESIAPGTRSTTQLLDEPESIVPEKAPTDGFQTLDGYFNSETIETIPEMKEVRMQAAIETGIAPAFDLIHTIEKKGLEYPLEENADLAQYLCNYLVFRHDVSEGEKSDNEKVIEIQRIEEYARMYLKNSLIEEKMELILAPLSRDGKVSVQYGPQNYWHDDFKVSWKDIGDKRIVRLSDFKNWNQVREDVMEYTFVRDKNAVFRLLDAQYVPFYSKRSAPDGMREIEDTQLASCLVGSFGDNLIALDEWDRNITMSTVDKSSFAIKDTVTIKGEYHSHHISNGKLYLLCADKVAVFDETLSIMAEENVPKVITDIQNRPPVLESDGDYPYNTLWFDGYSVSSDLSLYAYTFEGGSYIYDVKTGKTTCMIEEGTEHFIDGKIVMGPTRLSDLRFTADDTLVYGRQSVYEGPSIYYCYEVETGKCSPIPSPDNYDTLDELEKMQVICDLLVTPNNSNFRYEFSWMYNDEPPFLGNDYYFIVYREFEYQASGPKPTETTIYTGELTNPNLDDAKIIKIPDPYYDEHPHITVLSDDLLMYRTQETGGGDIHYGPQFFLVDITR